MTELDAIRWCKTNHATVEWLEDESVALAWSGGHLVADRLVSAVWAAREREASQ